MIRINAAVKKVPRRELEDPRLRDVDDPAERQFQEKVYLAADALLDQEVVSLTRSKLR